MVDAVTFSPINVPLAHSLFIVDCWANPVGTSMADITSIKDVYRRYKRKAKLAHVGLKCVDSY